MEPDAFPEGFYFHVFDCYVASVCQVYSCQRTRNASCSLKGVACPINHNVVSLNHNLIINVICKSVNVSVSLNLICSFNRPVWSDVYIFWRWRK